MAAGAHEAGGMLGGEERRLRIGVHLQVPMLRSRIIGGGWRKHGSAVNEDVEAAELGQDTVKHFLDGAVVGEIRLKHSTFSAGNVFGLGLARPVMDSDLGASGCQRERDFSSNAFCRTGD